MLRSLTLVGAASLAAVTVLVAATLPVPVAHRLGMVKHAPTRVERVGLAGGVVHSSAEVRGRLTFRVPQDWENNVWTIGGHSLKRTRQFTATTTSGCEVEIAVSTRTVATRSSTSAQVEEHLIPARRATQLGRGRRAHGSWGVDELRVGPSGGNLRALDGAASVHVAGNVYVQIRVAVQASRPDGQPCSDDDVRSGPLPAAIKRVLRYGKVQARLRARKARAGALY